VENSSPNSPEQPELLLGDHDLSLDEKNRVLIPSALRQHLNPERDGEKFILIIGDKAQLWLYPERVYRRMVAGFEEELAPDEEDQQFDLLFFSMAQWIELDKQGRILLPDKYLKRTGIQKDITMVGARNHIRIWKRSDWEAARDELQSNRSQIITRFKQKMKRRRPPNDNDQGRQDQGT
jgi:division/cell wall cluster transcriptional repressor MraZ